MAVKDYKHRKHNAVMTQIMHMRKAAKISLVEEKYNITDRRTV